MSEEKNKKPSVWSKYTDEDKKNLEELSKGYIDFISNCKTERESVKEAIRAAKEKGYRDLNEIIKSGEKLNIEVPTIIEEIS